MRIAESSALEFGLVRKILSAHDRHSIASLTSATPFLPGRVGFIGPVVRDSFIRRVFGPTYAFERAASVFGFERTKERILYLLFRVPG